MSTASSWPRFEVMTGPAVIGNGTGLSVGAATTPFASSISTSWSRSGSRTGSGTDSGTDPGTGSETGSGSWLRSRGGSNSWSSGIVDAGLGSRDELAASLASLETAILATVMLLRLDATAIPVDYPSLKLVAALAGVACRHQGILNWPWVPSSNPKQANLAGGLKGSDRWSEVENRCGGEQVTRCDSGEKGWDGIEWQKCDDRENLQDFDWRGSLWQGPSFSLKAWLALIVVEKWQERKKEMVVISLWIRKAGCVVVNRGGDDAVCCFGVVQGKNEKIAGGGKEGCQNCRALSFFLLSFLPGKRPRFFTTSLMWIGWRALPDKECPRFFFAPETGDRIGGQTFSG